MCKTNLIKNVRPSQESPHHNISKFTEFGDVWLDSDHVVSFQKTEK